MTALMCIMPANPDEYSTYNLEPMHSMLVDRNWLVVWLIPYEMLYLKII